MKNLIVVILIFLLPSLASAENIGVAETNFSVSGKIGTVESKYKNYEDSSAKLNLISGMANFPLGQYGGATGYFKLGESSYSSSETRYSEKTYGGLFFLRNASLGRVGFGYDNGKKTEESVTRTGISSINETMYSVLVDFYYHDLTLAVERFNIKRKYPINFDNESEFNISSISGIWHLHENLLLRLSTIGMDLKDSNSISLIYQPEVFNRTTSFTVKYLKIDTYPDSDSSLTQLSVNYYFGTRVSLKSRERKYSSYLYTNFYNQI